MSLIAKFANQPTGKVKMSRDELVGLIRGYSNLMAPLNLGWKARTQAELALMAELHPLLTKRARGRDISGLSAYDL